MKVQTLLVLALLTVIFCGSAYATAWPAPPTAGPGAGSGNNTNDTAQATSGTYDAPVVGSDGTTPTLETPATMSSATLYSLLAIVLGVVVLVAVVVVSAVKRHERVASSHDTLPTPPISPVTTTAPTSEGLVVHHPSVQEARQHVARCRELGYTDQQIRDQFVHYGWTDEQAAIAMRRE